MGNRKPCMVPKRDGLQRPYAPIRGEGAGAEVGGVQCQWSQRDPLWSLMGPKTPMQFLPTGTTGAGTPWN